MKLTGVCIALLILCGSSTAIGQDKVTEFSISKADPAVIALEGCGDHGTCFSVNLTAPGNIVSIDYSCEGHACGWVHPCPDGGNCNLRANEYVLNGSNATWFGWTNSGDVHAVYHYRIHYQ
jgi:hypothetical protein